jgi:hypothetical protein
VISFIGGGTGVPGETTHLYFVCKRHSYCLNDAKIKKQKITHCRTVLKPKRKIRERVKIDTSDMQRNNRSLSWLGTDTSIKSGRVKLALWTQIFPLRTKNTRETIQHYI